MSGSRLIVSSLLLMAPLLSVSAASIEICTGLDCSSRQVIGLNTAERSALEDLFATPAGTAAHERARIAEAIAMFERIAGRKSAIYLDQGRNPGREVAAPDLQERRYGWPLIQNRRAHDSVTGQLDCVAESINTTRFLTYLQDAGWLQHHRVGDRVFRRPRVFDQHWSAQIETLNGEERYVVDSWFLDNGHPPVIQPLDDWLDDEPVEDS